ncbi:hypothetical protein FOS14_15590, partial [Skermania sp. ID1734]
MSGYTSNMLSGTVRDEAVESALGALESAAAVLLDTDTESLSNDERLSVLARLETLTRRLPAAQNALLNQIDEHSSSEDFAGTPRRHALAERLRI